MPRTQVATPDLAAAIVTALNNLTLNGGQLKAVLDGQNVRVYAHSDGVVAGQANQFLIHIT